MPDASAVVIVGAGLAGLAAAIEAVFAAEPRDVSLLHVAFSLHSGGTPPRPARRDQLLQKMPMGSVGTCLVRDERPFWRDEGLAGSTEVLAAS
jgi:monoamine oxidase